MLFRSKELQLGPRVPAREFVTVTFEEEAVAGDDLWSNPITCYLTGLNWRRAGGWVAGGLSGLAALGLLIQRRRRRVARTTAAARADSPPAATAASSSSTASSDGQQEPPSAETSATTPPRRRPTPAASTGEEIGRAHV